MKVSVVIPAYNAAKTIGLCLESLTNQQYKNDFEIIVVDDGSEDTTKKIVTSFKGVKYIKKKNGGPASARNVGWKKSNGDIVIFTDSDCVPENDWFIQMIRPFSFNSEIGAVGGMYNKTINSSSKLAKLVGKEIKYRYLKIGQFTDAQGSYSLAVRKNVLKEIGGFNEYYPVATAEDWDLCFKITKKGYKIYFAKKAKISHHHPENLLKYFKIQFRHGFYRVKLYKDHPDMMREDKYSSNAKRMILLSGILILSLLLAFISVYFLVISLVILVSILFLQKDLYGYLRKYFSFIDSVSMLCIQIVRSICWGLGFFKGLLVIR